MTHPQVPHPRERLVEREVHWLAAWNDRVLVWLTDHMLSSMLMFDAALILPLLALPAPDGVKLTLGVISGSWFQWWALPALQRTAVKADVKRDAKADADHQALSHIAVTGDANADLLRAVADHLGVPTGGQ